MKLSISRIYAVDGVETCILAEDDNPQALLRAVEQAAEQIGAAPNALPFTGAAAAKKPSSRKKGEEVTAKAEEAAPTLPPGVAAAFPPPPSAPPQLPFPQQPGQILAPPPGPPADQTFVPPAEVTWGDAPPVQFGSQVGVAPPAAPPPVFAPPPPPPVADPREPLRRQVDEVQRGVIAMITTRNPGWVDAVAQTLNAIVAAGGGDVRTMSDEQLASTLGQFRRYEDTLKKSLGIA